jgi:hypothetical protein
MSRPINAAPSIPSGGCCQPVGLPPVVNKVAEIVERSIESASSDSARKAMIVLCRCARGGKTTTLSAIATALHKSNINCMFVSFNSFSGFFRQAGESDSDGLYRLITNNLDPSMDPLAKRESDWDGLDKYIGTDKFVLIIDEINALSSKISENLQNTLKKYFLDKRNRHLVVSSHVPVFLQDSTCHDVTDSVSPISMFSDLFINNRPICLLQMPESTDTNVLNTMGCTGITSGMAVYYGGIPSLIYLKLTQPAEDPAVRFSRLRSGAPHDIEQFAAFIEALVTGQMDRRLEQYLKFCSSVVSIPSIGVEVQWPPCYSQCIIRQFTNIYEAQLLSREMIEIADTIGKEKLWEQICRVAILQHLIIAKYKGGAGPFQICEMLNVSNAIIRVEGLGKGVTTVEEAMDEIQNYIAHCERPTLAIYYPNEACLNQVDGFVAVILPSQKEFRIAGYRCSHGEDNSKGNIPKFFNYGGYVLRLVTTNNQTSLNSSGWRHCNQSEMDLFLGCSLSFTVGIH